jgi:hypothetical protein
MIRTISSIAIALCSTILLNAETVSLKGTVKKTGDTTGIADVTIGLTIIKNLSALTGASGSFAIEGATSIQLAQNRSAAFQFTLKGATIVFSPTPRGATGKMDIFSYNGKIKASFRLNDHQTGKQNMTLPEIGPGIYLIRVAIDGTQYTRSLVSLDNGLFLINENSSTAHDGRLTRAKQASATIADTLVASKNGYITKKVPIDSYLMHGIRIDLDSSTCSRRNLQAAVDSYIEAQKAGDPSKMPIAPNVKFFQNQKSVTADKSICATALPIAFHRDFLDTDSCQTFSEVIVTEGGHPYVWAMRLKCDNEKISEVNAIVTDKGDWLFNASKYLTKSSQDETWDTIPFDKRPTRQALIDACNAYFDYIGDQSVDLVPWGSPCYRVEGGLVYITPCSDGIKGLHVNIPNRTYLFDPVMGTINAFCFFGYAPDSHIIRFKEGKILYVHTLTACGDVTGDCW